MRLWSIHPKYLDRLGLLSVWREGILALSVLEKGPGHAYYNHPQLDRWKNRPIASLQNYLYFIWKESHNRDYQFKIEKIMLSHEDWIVDCPQEEYFLPVTIGQLIFEFAHLQRKLAMRDVDTWAQNIDMVHNVPPPQGGIEANPIFQVINDIEKEPWEKSK